MKQKVLRTSHYYIKWDQQLVVFSDCSHTWDSKKADSAVCSTVYRFNDHTKQLKIMKAGADTR